MSVSLKEIVGELQAKPEDWSSYVDRETGELITLPDELLGALEEEDEPVLGEVELADEDVDLGRRICDEPERFVQLPTAFDLDEWDIMRRFAEEQDSDELLDAIHGRGAFGRFKDAVGRQGLAEEWYRFRDEAMGEVVREWLEEEGVDYQDDLGRARPGRSDD